MEWISVKDRLPEWPHAVIMAIGKSITNESCFATEGCYYDGKWMYSCGVIPPGNVTHWMPLPTAPEVE